MAGFTTIQSLGSPADVPLRDAIASGSLPGPRILTAVEPLTGQGEKSGTPDEIRALVQKQKEAGADVIKIFANYSVRQPAMRLSQDQLSAACEKAKKLGLRSLVHAYSDAVRAATLAGCTQIEHGVLATDDDLKLMASKGTFLDPQAGLVWENYLLNKEKFVGTPGYPASLDGFRSMEQLIPIYHEFMQRASHVSGLKIVLVPMLWQARTGVTRRNSLNGSATAEWILWRRWFPPIHSAPKLLPCQIKSDRSLLACRRTSLHSTGIH